MKAGSSPASATLKICWKQENRLLKQEQTWYGRFWNGENYMIKSEKRTTEYCVIVQPRHREQSPICYKGYAKDKEENSDWHKEVLDVKVSYKIEWNTDTAKRYWNMYGVPTGTNHTEIRLF